MIIGNMDNCYNIELDGHVKQKLHCNTTLAMDKLAQGMFIFQSALYNETWHTSTELNSR